MRFRCLTESSGIDATRHSLASSFTLTYLVSSNSTGTAGRCNPASWTCNRLCASFFSPSQKALAHRCVQN